MVGHVQLKDSVIRGAMTRATNHRYFFTLTPLSFSRSFCVVVVDVCSLLLHHKRSPSSIAHIASVDLVKQISTMKIAIAATLLATATAFSVTPQQVCMLCFSKEGQAASFVLEIFEIWKHSELYG
jgi:hypothetical protein